MAGMARVLKDKESHLHTLQGLHSSASRMNHTCLLPFPSLTKVNLSIALKPDFQMQNKLWFETIV